jgi:hypothetical protein
MRRFVFIVLLCMGMLHMVSAQTLKKYAIGKSGCSANFFCNPGTFEVTHSPDSSVVYTGECKDGAVTYDVICVQLKEKIANLKDAEQILEQYLDYIKSSFGIEIAAGYGKGHRLRGKEDTKGMIDYWIDKEKNKLNVKGWTNGQYIAVLIAISDKEIPYDKSNLFLDGIVFPEVKK